MTYLHTCVGCFYAADTCDRRDELKAAIKGLGISSVKHRCLGRYNIYKRGDAVKVHTVNSTEGSIDDHTGIVLDWFDATVVQQVGGRVVVFVADATEGQDSGAPFEASNNGFVKAPLSRIKSSGHCPARIPEDS